MGADISRQLLAQPKALMIAGSMMFIFGLVPGFPTAVFFTLGPLLLGTGYLLRRILQSQSDNEEQGSVPAMAPAHEPSAQAAKRKMGSEDEFSLTVPLMIDIDANVETALSAHVLNEELIKIRRALYLDLGVPFPGIHLRFTSSLSNGEYRILIQETPMATGAIKVDHVFCRERTSQLDVLGIRYETAEDFLPGSSTVWVHASYADKLSSAGIPFFSTSQVLTYHLSFILTRYAADFVGIQETRFLLTRMEDQFGELVKEVQRVVPIQKITEVYQRLVSEEISIRDLRTINQALIEWGQKEKDSVLLCEYIRGSVRRYISYKYSNGHNMLPAYILTPDAEEMVRNGIRQTSAGSYLALDPRVTQNFVQTVKRTVGDLSKSRQRPVMVVSMDIRRYVRKLIEKELYELPVLSYQDLTQEITVQPLDQISV